MEHSRIPNDEENGASPGPAETRRSAGPRLGIYTGAGASHSWLWFVDLFEKIGFFDLAFLDETDVQNGRLNGLHGFAVAGGDTFTLAGALGSAGARRLAEFVQGGGIYIGSCAGAYLPMRSSKPPLNRFNFVDVKITNLTAVLPTPQRLADKFCTAYGCRFVFHPIREAVRLRLSGESGASGQWVDAPLYGGPGMIAGEGAETLATYQGFTDKTLFLVDRPLAEKILLGNAAVVRQESGRGVFYLFGPHFEHPRYPDANRFLVEILRKEIGRRPEKRKSPSGEAPEARPMAGKKLVRDVKRELSNARIVATGLEMAPLRWRIGEKIYEPVKIRVFLDAMWRRLRFLEKADRIYVVPESAREMVRLGEEITGIIRTLKHRFDEGRETTPQAIDLFHRLQRLSTAFLRLYFDTRAAGAPFVPALYPPISGESH